MMKSLLVAGLSLCLLLIGCADGPKNMTGNSATPTDHSAPDGKALFQANCATCHNPLKDATGPALSGSLQRWGGDEARLNSFIKNPAAAIKTDAYAKALYERWKPAIMTPFPTLSDAEIKAILSFANGR